MALNSQTLSDTRIYAQDTQPTDERDGILWVDTSSSPRDTYVYSGASNSWELVSPENWSIQNAAPASPTDGDGWIDTSISPPRPKTYEAATNSWENSGARDYAELTGTPTATGENNPATSGGYVAVQPYGSAPNWWDDDTNSSYAVNINDNSSVTFNLQVDQTEITGESDGVRFNINKNNNYVAINWMRAYFTDGSYDEFVSADIAVNNDWNERAFTTTGTIDYWRISASHNASSAAGYRTLDVYEMHPQVNSPAPHTHPL